AGDRRSGLKSFRLAHRLDASNEDAISGLFRLGALPAAPKRNGGWSVPFPLSAVFEKPTEAEIRSVEADWAARDLRPSNVNEVAKQTIAFRDWTASVRIVSHLVHGSLHYGAIIVPVDATPGCCPIIVDAKGVSPNYFPLTVENIESVSMMGDQGRKLIYVVPSFRGETLHIGDKTFTSEGDRRDALDGATDDAIALLNVALKTTPEADAKRICAFGHSRGGTVALLLGIRDRRIKCVVEWSGPTDWFYLMGTEGWSEQELWAEGIRIHADPMQTGGQNLERFYSKAIEGRASLADVRHNMIASSPLYFAERLPLSQFHYGLEDPSVPTRNGYALVEEFKRHKVAATRYRVFFYPGEGHDTDRINGPVTSRDFVLKTLGVK
ncbi:MAG: alpha/beta hydrolase family protein, partial [Candidatus Binatia bacterium]